MVKVARSAKRHHLGAGIPFSSSRHSKAEREGNQQGTAPSRADIDYDLLAHINALRKLAPAAGLAQSNSDSTSSSSTSNLAELEARAQELYGSSRRFVVYGSLGPGGPNHFRLEPLGSVWRSGFSVNGALAQEGWGASLGFPGLVWSRDGPHNPVQLLEADTLLGHWPVLDEFEGVGYVRSLVPVTNGSEVLVGNIYLLAQA